MSELISSKIEKIKMEDILKMSVSFVDYPLDRFGYTIKSLTVITDFLGENVRWKGSTSLKKILTDTINKFVREHNELIKIKPLMKHRKKAIMESIKALRK